MIIFSYRLCAFYIEKEQGLEKKQRDSCFRKIKTRCLDRVVYAEHASDDMGAFGNRQQLKGVVLGVQEKRFFDFSRKLTVAGSGLWRMVQQKKIVNP